MTSTVIREAVESDAGTIMRLIAELAEFERLAHEVRATEADILRDGFGPQRYFECLLAEVDGEAAGFALFFHDYSTFEGRPGIYLEDLYVDPDQRGRGLGRRLIARLAALAVARNCRRLDLSVLHWNPAREIYSRLGFEQKADWLPYRLSGDKLKQLAETDEA
jgi:GNAT superfamily N-acetyltransferase